MWYNTYGITIENERQREREREPRVLRVLRVLCMGNILCRVVQNEKKKKIAAVK